MNRFKKISEMKYCHKGLDFILWIIDDVYQRRSTFAVSFAVGLFGHFQLICPHSSNANIDKKEWLKSSNKALCGVLAIICLLAFIPYYKLVTKRLMEKVSKHRLEKNLKDAISYNRLVFLLSQNPGVLKNPIWTTNSGPQWIQNRIVPTNLKTYLSQSARVAEESYSKTFKNAVFSVARINLKRIRSEKFRMSLIMQWVKCWTI